MSEYRPTGKNCISTCNSVPSGDHEANQLYNACKEYAEAQYLQHMQSTDGRHQGYWKRVKRNNVRALMHRARLRNQPAGALLLGAKFGAGYSAGRQPLGGCTTLQERFADDEGFVVEEQFCTGTPTLDGVRSSSEQPRQRSEQPRKS